MSAQGGKGIEAADNLFQRAYSVSRGELQEVVKLPEEIIAIGYADCHTVLQGIMVNPEAREEFLQNPTGIFATAINQVIGFATLKGQTTRASMLQEYGITQ